jgi:hypothetical protein
MRTSNTEPHEEHKIEIEYNGGYPSLCSGDLKVIIDGFLWIFPDHSLSSGGGVWLDEDWREQVDSGPWFIREWPEGFPEDLKDAVTEVVNDKVPFGCCGGCV